MKWSARPMSPRQRKLRWASAICLLATFGVDVATQTLHEDKTIRLIGAAVFFVALIFNFFVVLRGLQEAGGEQSRQTGEGRS